MNILNKIKDHPNQFLGFEILIFIWYFGCAFVYRFIGMHLSLASFIATLTMLIVMTAMGFIIPQKPLPKKIYLIAELFILFLPYISKNFLNLPLLGVFVLLRAYQMFGIKIVRPSSIMLTLFILISTLFTKSFLTVVLNNNNDFMDNIVIIKSNYIFWLINIMLLINYMISNSESKKKLNVALDQLRKYSIQIEEQSRMLERNRIAYDIHDSLGHNLAAQSILIENIIQLSNMNNNDKVNNLFSVQDKNIEEGVAKITGKGFHRKLRHSQRNPTNNEPSYLITRYIETPSWMARGKTQFSGFISHCSY